MRVLMLSKACLVGIYQPQLEYIAAHPAVSALEVIVPPAWKDERGEMVLERAFTRGYQLRASPIRFNGQFHWYYYPQFERLARAFQPDIIHIDEEPYNLATWLALRVARRLSAKSLFFSWQNIYRHYPPPFRWGERWTLNTVDYALFGTDSAETVWRHKGYAGRGAVIPQFGVDLGLFPARAARPTAPAIIGYVGRLVPEKGVDLILRALVGCPSEWQLWIIGGGPAEQELRQLAQDLGLAGQVVFKGQVSSLEMPAIYPQLDILVLPSRTLPNWKEQFGRVIIEAMAAEVAVVGSDSGAIPDVIGDAGLIFPEDQIEGLRQHFITLLENPAERQAWGQRGRQRVLAHFTQEQVAAKMVTVYQEMLNSAG